MALADDIRTLRDRALTDLTAAHDYYTDTKAAWSIVRWVVKSGHALRVRSLTTGTVTTQADLLRKTGEYVAGQLTEATFQQFVSIFESYLFDLLRPWLSAYPRSLGARQVDLKTILDAPDKDAVTLLVVTKEVSDVCTTGQRSGSNT